MTGAEPGAARGSAPAGGTGRGTSHWFVDRIAGHGDRVAFAGHGGTVSHARVAAMVAEWGARLDRHGVAPGEGVVVLGDHAAEPVALMLALAARGAVVTPLADLPPAVVAERARAAAADWLIDLGQGGAAVPRRLSPGPRGPLLERLAESGRAGLILFSSGSSGAPKACLLDLDSLLETAATPRPGHVTLAFLLFDHIGGINTAIRALGHGGTVVVLRERGPEAVAAAIAGHRVELLPASPTFLRMLLISGAAERHDLSSLRLITYGTEVMAPATLAALARAFPQARLKQTYGLSEIGIVPTRSRAPDQLWVKIGVEHRVIDGILWLRAPTAMLGYLNAPSPFDADGWLNTGDRVETDGPWLCILGRDSELINVGGAKVHPAEVEAVLLAAGNIRDATVAARASPVSGTVVEAVLDLIEPETPAALRARLSAFCRDRLEPHKVPLSFRIAAAPLHSERFKKRRDALA